MADRPSHGAVGGEVTASSAGVSETAELSALAGEWRINRGLTERIHDLANRHKLELASEPKWAGPYTSHVTWLSRPFSSCRCLLTFNLKEKPASPCVKKPGWDRLYERAPVELGHAGRGSAGLWCF